MRLLVAAATSRDEAVEPKVAAARNQAEFMGISFGGVGFTRAAHRLLTRDARRYRTCFPRPVAIAP